MNLRTNTHQQAILALRTSLGFLGPFTGQIAHSRSVLVSTVLRIRYVLGAYWFLFRRRGSRRLVTVKFWSLLRRTPRIEGLFNFCSYCRCQSWTRQFPKIYKNGSWRTTSCEKYIAVPSFSSGLENPTSRNGLNQWNTSFDSRLPPLESELALPQIQRETHEACSSGSTLAWPNPGGAGGGWNGLYI